MNRIVATAGFVGSMLLGALTCHGANWVKLEIDPPNKNVELNQYDAESVKVDGKTLNWTEKFDLTKFGSTHYTRHLATYPFCQENIVKKGDVAYHQIDLQIKDGQYRQVAKRNYTKNNELICTDKEMGTEFDTSWAKFPYQSPIFLRYYEFVTKFKLGNI